MSANPNMECFSERVVQRTRRMVRIQGVSIIEFMIAITVGTFITLGILILTSRTSRSYKINDEYSRMQEAGSTALNLLGNDIHMAGFYGLAGTSDTISAYDTNPADGKLDYGQDAGINWGTAAGPQATLGDCVAANWSFQPAVPVWGLPSTTAPSAAAPPLNCINTANNFITGPVLVLRGAAGLMINNNGSGFPQNVVAGLLDPNTIYIQSDPGNGFIFQGVNYAAYKNAGYSRATPAGPGVFVDAPIYQYQSNIYYLRPCSRPTGGPDAWGNALCQATDDAPNPDPIPTLVRQQWQSTPAGPVYTEVPLVEGVEAWNVMYGLDTLSAGGQVIPAGCNTAGACATPPDGVADSYTLAPASLNAWSQVVTIKINLLVRSTAPSAGYNDAPKTYDLGGGITFNCGNVLGTQPDACLYHRHLFSQLFEVRNIVGRR